MTRNDMIEMLVKEGAKRWTKGDNDRLYLGNAGKAFGFEIVERYRSSARISAAKLDGDFISNNYAAQIDDELSNIYIDLNTMAIGYNTSTRKTVISERVQEMLDSLTEDEPEQEQSDEQARKTKATLKTTECFLFSDQEKPDYIVSTKGGLISADDLDEETPMVYSSFNCATITECIDDLLNNIERLYADPTDIDWTGYELTDEQSARISSLHERFNMIRAETIEEQ